MTLSQGQTATLLGTVLQAANHRRGNAPMPSPRQPRVGRPHLERDRQQYALDWMIKETGRVQHFQPDGRGRLPRAVRSHAMISKHVGLAARRMERLAEAEAEAG